jgi:hypothetical protein
MGVMQGLLHVCKCVRSGGVVAEVQFSHIFIDVTSRYTTHNDRVIACAKLTSDINTRSLESVFMESLTSYLQVSHTSLMSMT